MKPFRLAMSALLALLALLVVPRAGLAASVAPPVTLPDTADHVLHSATLGRTYHVWVALPPGYGDGDRRFPVVFVADANYAFPLVRALRGRVGAHGQNIEDFILVGLAYSDGSSPIQSRNRDYTPTRPQPRAGFYSNTEYGDAARYRDFVEQEVFPLIARNYRADMQRKVFAGHSFGALFGSFVLLTRPQMFQQYILSSPSLWFDEKRIFRVEADWASAHKDLPAQVALYAGAYETHGAGPRYFNDNDVVGDMHAFERTLKARHYPGLRVQSEVIPDEDHLTANPASLTRGLLWALPGRGPYVPG